MSGREGRVSTLMALLSTTLRHRRRHAVALLLVAACGRSRVTPAAAPVPEASPSVAVQLPGTASAQAPEAPWPALVRDEEWDTAWRALEALAEAERSSPEVRYVRSR